MADELLHPWSRALSISIFLNSDMMSLDFLGSDIRQTTPLKPWQTKQEELRRCIQNDAHSGRNDTRDNVWCTNKNKLDCIDSERVTNQELTDSWSKCKCVTVLCFALEGVEDKYTQAAFACCEGL